MLLTMVLIVIVVSLLLFHEMVLIRRKLTTTTWTVLLPTAHMHDIREIMNASIESGQGKPVVNPDILDTQKEKMKNLFPGEARNLLMNLLNTTLEDFRYPTRNAVEQFRLPDYYFASTSAKTARRAPHRFKRLHRIYSRLFVEKEPVHVSILGGSNSAGSGLGKSAKDVRQAYNQSYAVRLERWLNKFFPPKEGAHIVHNFGRGAVGSCYFQLLFEKLTDPGYVGAETDLFILETSVNDVLSNDMECFHQLVSKISTTYPNASIISLHLASGPDFFMSCNLKQVSLSYCHKKLHGQEGALLAPHKHKKLAMWCKKLKIVDEFRILQVDLEMLRHMVCRSMAPFQHTRATSETTMHPSAQSISIRRPHAKQRLLEFIARTNPDQLSKEALLLTLGTYNNTASHDKNVITSYKRPFAEVEAAIAAKLGPTRFERVTLGDLVVFSSDRVHIGRWGHLLVTAEIAIWLTWLSVVGQAGIEEERPVRGAARNNTVWAATTFDMSHYNRRSRSKATNKHKPIHNKAVLDIYPLQPMAEAQGWKLYDDSGMQKRGLITQDPEPRNISFKVPRHRGDPCDLFIIRLGYLKSYAGLMGNFSVDLHETISDRHVKSYWTGLHEELVSVFVDSVIGVIRGANDIVITITSAPKGTARKVKIVGLYVTQETPEKCSQLLR